MVAPLVGAWIEIYLLRSSACIHGVAPLVGAWIEIIKKRSVKEAFESLPSWERGLKSTISAATSNRNKSLPSWERGLKFVVATYKACEVWVAPLVGAWIEIVALCCNDFRGECRSPRGSVD